MAVRPDEHMLIQRTDIAEHAVGLLLAQWRDKPRIAAFARALGRAAQLLHDDLFDLLVSRDLDIGVGPVLDWFGAIVGEERGGLDDADYRRFIRARILANRSSGTTDEVIAVLQLSTSPSTVVVTPVYPAAFDATVTRDERLGDEVFGRVRRLVDDVRPAGVAARVVEVIPNCLGMESLEGLDGPGKFTRRIL